MLTGDLTVCLLLHAKKDGNWSFRWESEVQNTVTGTNDSGQPCHLTVKPGERKGLDMYQTREKIQSIILLLADLVCFAVSYFGGGFFIRIHKAF